MKPDNYEDISVLPKSGFFQLAKGSWGWEGMIKDGGAAYPGPEHKIITGEPHGGMTMRQFYKAAALAGLLADNATQPQAWDCVAQICGEAADALIAEDDAHGKERK